MDGPFRAYDGDQPFVFVSYAHRDAELIYPELGARYIPRGSVRRAQGTVRVSVNLLDAASGMHIWSERYDRPYHDVFCPLVQLIATDTQFSGYFTRWPIRFTHHSNRLDLNGITPIGEPGHEARLPLVIP